MKNIQEENNAETLGSFITRCLLTILLMGLAMMIGFSSSKERASDFQYLNSLRAEDTLKVKQFRALQPELKESTSLYDVYRIAGRWITVEPKTFVIKSIWQR